MPECNILTVSQKIEEKEEIDRLLGIIKNEIPDNMGAIIRTSAKNVEESIIINDLKALLKRWKKIKKDYEDYNLNGPKLIYDNKALIRRTLIDIVDQNLNKVIVNNKKNLKDIEDILLSMNMREQITIEFKENYNLLDLYGLGNQVEKLQNRKIWLKCGGFITIDRTEALTAIDVNTGKYTGKKNLEETILEVNKQATVEIAKQLRLRDIGGIIIIDYIDMMEEDNKNKIIKILNDCLKSDRTKNQVIGFTKLNLLEMTRKNMCNNDSF